MASTSKYAQQPYDYFIVMDFEAQCERGKFLNPQEIIEFPALLVNGQNFEIVSEFHHYVRPTVHKQLTAFCTELTGITQQQLEGQPELPRVLKLFNSWLYQHGLLAGPEGDIGIAASTNGQYQASFAFVTCGDWDLKTCLPRQAAYLGIQLPTYFNQWVNIKTTFKQWAAEQHRGTGHGNRARQAKTDSGMVGMLAALGLPLIGRHHSGIDDSRNIAAILRELAGKGVVFSTEQSQASCNTAVATT